MSIRTTENYNWIAGDDYNSNAGRLYADGRSSPDTPPRTGWYYYTISSGWSSSDTSLEIIKVLHYAGGEL